MASKDNRIPSSFDDPNYASLDDPLIAYFGFRPEDRRSNAIISAKLHNKDIDENGNVGDDENARIIFEINKSRSNRLCRRRFTSYSDKLSVQKTGNSDYNELLKARQNLRSTGSIREENDSTTHDLTEVLSQYRESEQDDISLDGPKFAFPTYLSSKDSVDKYVEREARLYREEKLYKDIEAELMETVAVIERIGKSRDLRRSVVSINEADRVNLINSCALELDALNKVKSKKKPLPPPKSKLHNRFLNAGQIEKKTSLKEKLKNSFRHKKKHDSSSSETASQISRNEHHYSQEEKTDLTKSASGELPEFLTGSTITTTTGDHAFPGDQSNLPGDHSEIDDSEDYHSDATYESIDDVFYAGNPAYSSKDITRSNSDSGSIGSADTSSEKVVTHRKVKSRGSSNAGDHGTKTSDSRMNGHNSNPGSKIDAAESSRMSSNTRLESSEAVTLNLRNSNFGSLNQFESKEISSLSTGADNYGSQTAYHQQHFNQVSIQISVEDESSAPELHSQYAIVSKSRNLEVTSTNIPLTKKQMKGSKSPIMPRKFKNEKLGDTSQAELTSSKDTEVRKTKSTSFLRVNEGDEGVKPRAMSADHGATDTPPSPRRERSFKIGKVLSFKSKKKEALKMEYTDKNTEKSREPTNNIVERSGNNDDIEITQESDSDSSESEFKGDTDLSSLIDFAAVLSTEL